MQILIEGEPKEIAALVLAVQERQEKQDVDLLYVGKTAHLRKFVPEDSNGTHNGSEQSVICPEIKSIIPEKQDVDLLLEGVTTWPPIKD